MADRKPDFGFSLKWPTKPGPLAVESVAAYLRQLPGVRLVERLPQSGPDVPFNVYVDPGHNYGKLHDMFLATLSDRGWQPRFMALSFNVFVLKPDEHLHCFVPMTPERLAKLAFPPNPRRRYWVWRNVTNNDPIADCPDCGVLIECYIDRVSRHFVCPECKGSVTMREAADQAEGA